TDGTGFTVLHSFDVTDGSGPYAALTLDASGNLYGTTGAGGPAGNGVVFTLKTDGSAYNVLHPFGSGDGARPYASLALDASGFLYGTTRDGGSGNQGIAFKVKTDGSGYLVLHEFNGSISDGATPYGGLVLDGSGNLYGTTHSGGANALGTVYTIKTD